jgi:hypothetical protein
MAGTFTGSSHFNYEKKLFGNLLAQKGKRPFSIVIS